MLSKQTKVPKYTDIPSIPEIQSQKRPRPMESKVVWLGRNLWPQAQKTKGVRRGTEMERIRLFDIMRFWLELPVTQPDSMLLLAKLPNVYLLQRFES
ncbi:uncharacterized protein EAE98_003417 [Botrytis deweyae]|uniref:Uncharacterized protein n=2 Tax=Botrytis TaxID=33196 RepID=A0A4Z1I9A5_9HELO|nr:uncharacterized protein EAE98_003417 [Botrytis deweyae]KAF7933708.1 hypothetical protein EAE98_003417 [Botrytis deweyae]TGO58171.1 hypothetical protein BELL_1306g00010 [Botrytis elliptica]